MAERVTQNEARDGKRQRELFREKCRQMGKRVTWNEDIDRKRQGEQ